MGALNGNLCCLFCPTAGIDVKMKGGYVSVDRLNDKIATNFVEGLLNLEILLVVKGIKPLEKAPYVR